MTEKTQDVEATEYEALNVAIIKLNKELREMAKTMTAPEARLLVDAFETQQRERIRNDNRHTQLSKDGEPAHVLRHYADLQRRMESEIAVSLSLFVEKHPLTVWMVSQKGIGPLIAARLFAFVDWEKSHTPSQVWAFAGLDPNVIWGKGEKRPWNARLKRLCFLIGESFVKNQSTEKRPEGGFYPNHFTRRKREEWKHNLNGDNSEAALIKAEEVGKTTEAYRWYSGCVTAETARKVAEKTWPEDVKPWGDNKPGDGVPMLPPAHVHARARRWVVKLFLSHVWWRAQELKEGGAGDLTPYAPKFLSDEGHEHIIEPPE